VLTIADAKCCPRGLIFRGDEEALPESVDIIFSTSNAGGNVCSLPSQREYYRYFLGMYVRTDSEIEHRV